MSAPQKPTYQQLALESDVPPASKSDNKWLKDMGYRGGLHEFAIQFGFKPHNSEELEDARDLVDQFREEQQEEWEALRKEKRSAPPSSSRKGRGPEVENPREGTADLKEIKQQAIDRAILWHKRLGHADYEVVLRSGGTGRGIDSFGDLQVSDLPVCDICKRVAVGEGWNGIVSIKEDILR